MSCLTVKNFSENVKVLNALSPKTCPPVNKLRSSIYHPDVRTVDRYSCMKNPHFIPTDEILKTVKCKPEMPLYNMPRKGGPCGLKILNNDRRTNCCENYFSCNTSKKCDPVGNYPHRDVKKMYENLRDPGCDPCGLGIRPLLICRECGCKYRAKKPSLSQRPRPCRASPNSPDGPILVRMNCTRPSQQENTIYFSVDVLPCPSTQNCSETEIDSSKKKCSCSTCRSNSGSLELRSGDHFPDCQCKLCKKRKDNCPNRQNENEFLNECISESNNSNNSNSNQQQDQVEEGNPDWSNSVWFKCSDPSCECKSGSNSGSDFENSCSSNSSPAETSFNKDLSRIQSEACQKVVIRGKDGKPTAVPCHFCFVVDNSQRSSRSNIGMGNDCQQFATDNDGITFECGPDTATIPICGVGIGVNKNGQKRRNPVCGCFYCDSIAKHKKALHAPTCTCLMCEKFREHSRKRPHYYNSLRTKGCSSKNSSGQINQQANCSQNYMNSPQQEWSQSKANTSCTDPCRNMQKSTIEMVCPCHQFIPTNWERKGNCNGCPSTRNMTKLPRGPCSKRTGVCSGRDREVGAFCPPVLIRAMKKSSKCCDNFEDKSVKNEGQEKSCARSGSSVVSMGPNCKA